MGIETILSYNLNFEELKKYKGLSGWENIKNGILNFQLLKATNGRGFKDQKSRFVFFYLIPKLIEAPKCVLYDSAKAYISRVDCEFLFFDQVLSAYIHIGIERNERLGYYIPKTFLIEKITENNDGLKYISNQQEITVTRLINK